MLARPGLAGYNNSLKGNFMRAKTLLLITILAAYGYYLRTMSVALNNRADGLMEQYNAALSVATQMSGDVPANNLVVQYPKQR